MDGTLYLGDNVYEGAIELMNDLPKLGKKYIYLTNNSSRAGTDYITRLRRLGFPCEAENVFTSGMATGMYLNQRHPGAKVYLAANGKVAATGTIKIGTALNPAYADGNLVEIAHRAPTESAA